MDESMLLDLVKLKLGITSDIRDDYLLALIKGVFDSLTTVYGLMLDETNAEHQMFIVDYVTYLYTNQDTVAFPRHLQWRLHNLILSCRKEKTIDVE